MLSSGDIGRRFCLIGGVLCGFTAFCIGSYFVGSQCYKVSSYHAAPATILEWRLDHVVDGYRLVARYEYRVGGDTYSSRQPFSTPSWAGPDFSTMVATGRRFRPGERATAFYNPAHPDDAYLLRDELSGHCAFAYVGMAMIIFSIGIFGFGSSTQSDVRKRLTMFGWAVVWYVVASLSVVSYVTVSRVAHPQWFTAATIIYGLLGLIPLLYGLPAVRRFGAESQTLTSEVEA